MKKFYVDDCPPSLPVGIWIKSQLPWTEAKQDIFNESEYASVLNIEFDFSGDLPALQKAVHEAISEYGHYGWKTSAGDDTSYGGFSITYNPQLQYKDQPIHQHTLGTALNAPDQFYNGSIQNHEFLKNSYFDGMSFNELTPAAQIGYMGEFLRGMNENVTVTRSRLGIVSGKHANPKTPYHMDSEVFELTRLNIPISGDNNFHFNFDGLDPYVLNVGSAYTWQTEVPHRVYCHRESPIDRANMVIGWSPWLTYNREERYWYVNDFFGKKHPFQMLVDGDVTDKIKLKQIF
jgi:hypothetical protein